MWYCWKQATSVGFTRVRCFRRDGEAVGSGSGQGGEGESCLKNKIRRSQHHNKKSKTSVSIWYDCMQWTRKGSWRRWYGRIWGRIDLGGSGGSEDPNSWQKNEDSLQTIVTLFSKKHRTALINIAYKRTCTGWMLVACAEQRRRCSGMTWYPGMACRRSGCWIPKWQADSWTAWPAWQGTMLQIHWNL